MILLIDLGNTLTKIAIANEINNNISIVKSISTKNNNWVENIENIFLAIKEEIKTIIVSSVVPKKLPIINKINAKIFNAEVVVINFDLIKSLPLKINYQQKEIGSDLIALALASDQKFGNCITISLGTATTYTIINNNILKGVIIGPGFSNAKDSLVNNAALINSFQINKTESILATTTIKALSIGYGNGFNYMISGTIKAIKKELNTTLKIIVTGGNFQELKPFLEFNYHYEDNLVLQGLIIIYQILKKNNKLK